MVSRCRLCSFQHPNDQLKNIFTYKLQDCADSLVNVLFWVFAVEIDVTDPFEKEVCVECIEIIEYFIEVRKAFTNCQENLKKDQVPKVRTSTHLADNAKDFNSHQYYRTSGQQSKQCPSSSTTSEDSCEKTSPRIRVSLSNLDNMCQLAVNVDRWEDSIDYRCYKKLLNGAYKRRIYSNFKLADSLLNDIDYNSDEKQTVGFSGFKQNIGTSSKKALNNLRKNVGTNTDEFLNTCDCKNTKKTRHDCPMNNITKNISSSSSTHAEDDLKQTKFKKNFSTNTLSLEATSDTSNKENKTIIKVNLQDLLNFAQPKVILEPVEHLIKRQKYRKIRKNCYKLHKKQRSKFKKARKLQKQRKTIIYNQNKICKVAKIRDVWVCDFCSKSFFSQLSLKRHYKWKHASLSETTNNKLVENIFNNRINKTNRISGENLKFKKKCRKFIANSSETESAPSDCDDFNRNSTEQLKNISLVHHDHDYGKPPEIAETKKEISFFKNRVNDSFNMPTVLNLISEDKEKKPKLNKNIVIKKRSCLQRKCSLKRKFNYTINPVNDDDTEPTYVWERKCLGKYSAIKFYEQMSARKDNSDVSKVLKHGNRLQKNRINCKE